MSAFPVTRTSPPNRSQLVCTAVTYHEDSVRIAFTGALDTCAVNQFTETVLKTLHASAEPRLEVDLTDVRLIAVVGVRALLTCHRQAMIESRGLVISNPQPVVRLVLQAAGVLDLLRVEPAVDASEPQPGGQTGGPSVSTDRRTALMPSSLVARTRCSSGPRTWEIGGQP